ncbi:MAG: hypothetical protein HY914_03125 [Desulfomonile tiedjei]|nr:hypothetical protein [Desulfomonile tiedjei]
MGKGDSLQRADAASEATPSSNYDYFKAVVSMAKKNGWDIESLGLISEVRPVPPTPSLTRKEAMERSRLVRTVLKRFSRVLTPPVPVDLERSLREKDPKSLLPWEEEVLAKTDKWRIQFKDAEAEILDELRSAIMRPTESR